MMKNLFDYATKELSQDAFLCWLFNSWDDDDLKEVVFGLLRKFGVSIRSNNVKRIQAYTQIERIDIAVIVETKTKKYAIFIEDKTDSSEHDQLEKYDRKILGIKKNGYFYYPVLTTINKKLKEDFVSIPDKKSRHVIIEDLIIKRVFYKTSVLDPETDERAIEKSRMLPRNIPAAESVGDEGWLRFDIDAIAAFFKRYTKSPNMILRQYADHIMDVKHRTDTTTRPEGETNHQQWMSYYRNSLIPRLEERGYITNVYLWNGRESGIQIKHRLTNYHFADEENELAYVKIGTSDFIKMYEDDESNNINISVEIRGREDNRKKSKEAKNAFYREHEEEIIKLKTKIQEKHNAAPELCPLQICDYEKTIAKCSMPAGTDDELIESIVLCMNQLKKIQRRFRVIH